MPTVQELTDPYLGVLTTVPPAANGICDVCHRPIRAEYTRCYSCRITMAQVTRSVSLIVPISLCLGRQQLHHFLRGYKDPGLFRLTEPQRRQFEAIVAATFARFLDAHEQHILDAANEERPADAIVAIPSSKGRAGDPPLYTALRRVPSLQNRLRLALAPDQPIKHLDPRDDGFTLVEQELVGRTVLLVDDTFTSGAAVQSAASALQLSGVKVLAAIVVGRYVDISDEHQPSAEWWKSHRKNNPFTFTTCTVE